MRDGGHCASDRGKTLPGPAFFRIGTTLVIIIFALGLAGGFWMQPKMEKLRSEWYSTKATPEMKEQAHHTFNVWHGISQTANVLIIGGLLIHLLRVTRSPDSRNYGVLFPQFRG